LKAHRLWLLIVACGVVACSSSEDPDEDIGNRADELSGGPVYGSSGPVAGPAAKVVCGLNCGAGYTAVQPLCISTCGGCNPYGRNATQCTKNGGGGGGGPAATVNCGFGCANGLHIVQRLCISTCGGCNPYGSNAVQCSR
jgi:hypothetical protein